MKRKTQEKLFNSFVKEMGDTMLSKGHDYAGEDVLSNFKLVSEITSVPVEQVLLVFIATKTVRLSNLLKQEKQPNNESIQDNLKDLCNYNILLDMIRNEKDSCDLEKVENREPKVGDRVMVVNNDRGVSFMIGDEVKIIRIFETSKFLGHFF